jgi:hypothetical protein
MVLFLLNIDDSSTEMPHMEIVLAGTVLPKCKRCGDKVSFAPAFAAGPIETDVDFVEHDFAA